MAAAADESINPHGRFGPHGTTESSPLLGSSGATSYGSSTVPSSGATIVGDDEVTNGSSATVESGGAREEVAREGLPEMAKKMHILMPAIGIGIFLSALDQTLIVATYAKMSSDLEALNRTSWISTA